MLKMLLVALSALSSVFATEPISPRDLVAAVAELRRDLTFMWREMGIEPGYFASCDGRCEARIFETDLDGEPGAEALVKIELGYDLCRYVVFKRELDGRRWRVLGHIDHDFNKYEMSSHRVVRVGGVPFVVVRGQTGSGTGFSSYEDSWYRVGDDGLREVLAYEAKGHEAPWPCGVGRELRSRIVTPSSDGRVVEVRFRLKFTTYDSMRDEYTDILTVNRTARFLWNGASGSFEVEERRSGLSSEELRTAFGFTDGSHRASYDLLVRELDGKGRAKPREELGRFEQRCDEILRQFGANR